MADSDVDDDKQNFVAMIDDVHTKLARLSAGSPIKRCFPATRLDAIRTKVEANTAKDLEWSHWQPLFLFLKRCSDKAILAFDDDLRIVESHGATTDSRALDFLSSESANAQPWAGGTFEIFIKATMLRPGTLNCALDPTLANGRRPDMKIDLGARRMCIECTSLGESDPSDATWRNHTVALKADRNACLFEWQDAYTQSRRMYAKVFDKIAPRLDVHRSQLNDCGPNLLLISLNAVISDLTALSPAIGWALDELFASQPNGNRSPASLCEWLLRQYQQAQQATRPARTSTIC